MSKKKKGKRKNNKPKQPKANKSFLDLVSQANQNKLKPFIQQQVMGMYQNVMSNVNTTLEMAFYRIEALEGIVIEKLGITEEQLTDKVVELQNKADGLVAANDRAVKEDDTIRFEVSTKTKNQEEFSEPSRQILTNIGKEPFTYGEELEKPIIGMRVGETKEIMIGKDAALTTRITINHIAFKPAPEKVEKPKAKDQKPKKVEETNENKDGE